MKTLLYNGHKIEVKLWCKEKIFYDGKLMSSRHTLFGGTHVFQVEEEGETINYEVEIYFFPTLGMKVRRNGILIYSDK